MHTKLNIGRDYMKDKIKRKIKAVNKFKTFASWMAMTNILYIISVYVGNKIIASSNDLFMILSLRLEFYVLFICIFQKLLL